MDYKPVSETCASPGCGNPRRPGQRDCVVCHRKAQVAYRKRQKAKMQRLVAMANGARDAVRGGKGMEAV